MRKKSEKEKTEEKDATTGRTPPGALKAPALVDVPVVDKTWLSALQMFK